MLWGRRADDLLEYYFMKQIPGYWDSNGTFGQENMSKLRVSFSLHVARSQYPLRQMVLCFSIYLGI